MLVATVTRANLAGLGHDLGLDLVVLGVENLVLDSGFCKQPAELLRFFDGTGADQHRHTRFVPLDDLVGDRLELLLLGGEDPVREPDAAARAVGRDS